MKKINRRNTLSLMGLSLMSTVASGKLATASSGFAFNFVRIKDLAEQAVGEKILIDLYSRIGMSVSVEALPGRRALQLASTGEKDGETLRVYGLGETVASLKRMPVALSSLQTVAFRRVGSDVNLHSKEDLSKFSSVVIQGVLHTKSITEGINSVQEVPNAESIFKMVQGQRADLALTSGFDGKVWLKRLGISDLEQVPYILNEQPLYHYVHESKAAIFDKLIPIAEAMSVSGELEELRARIESEYLLSI